MLTSLCALLVIMQTHSDATSSRRELLAELEEDADISCLELATSCNSLSDDRNACLMSKNKLNEPCVYCPDGCVDGKPRKCAAEAAILRIMLQGIAKDPEYFELARDSCEEPEMSCNAHSDCPSNAPFCYQGECDSCSECHHCEDGIDGSCGICGEGYPTREDKECVADEVETEQAPQPTIVPFTTGTWRPAPTSEPEPIVFAGEPNDCLPDGTLCRIIIVAPVIDECPNCCNEPQDVLLSTCGTNWPDGTMCAFGTTCEHCKRPATHWVKEGITACGNEPCWEDGTVCGAGTTCNNCCNPARNAAGTQCGGNKWADGTLCALGTTCNFCQNPATHWDGRLGTRCGNEPGWARGTTCGKGTTCHNCRNGESGLYGDLCWMGICLCG